MRTIEMINLHPGFASHVTGISEAVDVIARYNELYLVALHDFSMPSRLVRVVRSGYQVGQFEQYVGSAMLDGDLDLYHVFIT